MPLWNYYLDIKERITTFLYICWEKKICTDVYSSDEPRDIFFNLSSKPIAFNFDSKEHCDHILAPNSQFYPQANSVDTFFFVQ